MYILGIESSCDECAASVVQDGSTIRSNVIATQIELHKPWQGVVPEIASRLHTRWIWSVVEQALSEAGINKDELDGIAVTNRPGLVGSLLVGLSFAKGLAWSLGVPFIGVDHIRAHLYAPHLENDIPYPYLGLLVSGGHTVISIVRSFDDIEVLGTTIDDACGEAFDKVAKYYDLGYPGGIAIDKLSSQGDPKAFRFPSPNLHKGDHVFDVSYSGLKTAVINQLDQFLNPGFDKTKENIAASFQKRAIDILIKKVKRAVEFTGIRTVVAGGGVTANSYMRTSLTNLHEVTTYYPSMELCTDNAAMIAGIGYQYLKVGETSDFSENAKARVPSFKRGYP
ncbi:tRNA (adenosine(37)-N6)-threonylcarbamoyltransferase complex transferase subunit TsaD [Oceanispirochaeta crateris]|uniref:tRNA N6-adenosine threonylcarbamoyltransferase n=1 Tax=Oceanispirochaeta crateris TaxID=2518645 RepID=A0A5C1QMK0_9SPIO|nr:tRNA (adenosine(37)-N6)-threonylcarbamoyltransferase complex transferase subunit TsaD [Oceanispirochaeta crateris]QEN07774.1 tRNA (adenosine(37)-N6)-threonylcarbamoyltransferase complex transferase subunit TsaD [Oceanispirochaeta crateris]